ncbi:MAG: hypothetical protein JJV98_16670 [Desulfosarcina sp.]|nr:hypothetical protein [Desulfobacterales bacterium]
MSAQTTGNNSFSFRVCRRSRVARDVRYDGIFYSGSSTTKIYCRPGCPGKPPRASNNIFFSSRTQAEKAGFRPCLRCRPELAPHHPIQKAAGWQVRNALGHIHQGLFPDKAFEAQDAPAKAPPDQMPIDFHAAVGFTLPGYWQTFQLGFAKMLLTDTALPLEDISSISRFDNSQNMLDALSNLYRRDPLAFRKPLPVQIQPGVESCALMLSYRPPFDWSALLNYFRTRAVAGVEKVADEVYQRSFCLNGHRGWLSLQNVSNVNAVRLEVHAYSLSCLMQVVWRVRRMLDLDADPLALEAFFGEDPLLGPAWLRHPGLRVPVGWEAFEFAVRAIVGQRVSVGFATKLAGNIVDAFAENLSLPAPKGIEKVFPSPAGLQGADLRPCGLTRNKAAAIVGLAQAVVNGTIDLENVSDRDTFIQQCTALRGIGEWTVQTIAMRGLGDKDAFPAGDLGIVKALSTDGQPPKPAHIRKIAERWRPLRSYAAMLLWVMRRS